MRPTTGCCSSPPAVRGDTTCAAAPPWSSIDGLERAGHAELEENPDSVAAIFKTLLDQLGPDDAKDLGLKLNIGRQPTAAEIQPAVASRGIARIRLDDAAGDSAERAGSVPSH